MEFTASKLESLIYKDIPFTRHIVDEESPIAGFSFIKELGRGSFSVVVLLKKEPSCDLPCVPKGETACKIFSGQRLRATLGQDTQRRAEGADATWESGIARREWRILRSLSACPTIVEAYHFQDITPLERDKQFIFISYMNLGPCMIPIERFSGIQSSATHGTARYTLCPSLVLGSSASSPPWPGYSEELCRHIFSGLCSALSYAHAHGVAHRDIKPENVLLGYDATSSDGNNHENLVDVNRIRVKLSDFGAAVGTDDVARDSDSTSLAVRDSVGTPAFWGPEVLDPTTYGSTGGLGLELEDDDHKSYTSYGTTDCMAYCAYCADVWAAGATLYVLFHAAPPFGGSHTDELFDAILCEQPTCHALMPQCVRTILDFTLRKDPVERVTAAELPMMIADGWG